MHLTQGQAVFVHISRERALLTGSALNPWAIHPTENEQRKIMGASQLTTPGDQILKLHRVKISYGHSFRQRSA